MRIRISLKAEKYPALIPINHRPLASFIYETVSLVSPKLSSSLYNESLRHNSSEVTDKGFKPFVFAIPQLPTHYVKDEYKCFDKGLVYWQISSPVADIIDSIVASLATNNSVHIGKSLFSVIDIETIPAPTFSEEMRFLALSPLTVYTNTIDINGRPVKHYLGANEEEFGKLVVSNLLTKYYALNGKEIVDSRLHFEFDQDYIKSMGGFDSEKITRTIYYGSTQIKGIFTPFIVKGNPELISLGWETGFGSNNSQGFGMAGI